MSLNQILYILPVALLALAVGAVALASRPAMREKSQILWAIAIVCVAAVLAFLVAAVAFNWL